MKAEQLRCYSAFRYKGKDRIVTDYSRDDECTTVICAGGDVLVIPNDEEVERT